MPRASPGPEASIVLRTERRKVPSHVAVGLLEGKSTDAIQVHSHHDSGYGGAVEDASGVAEVLALAEHFSKQPKASREKTLMFTTFDSHFSGYQAHNAFLERHVVARNPARDPRRIVSGVTLEHLAKHALVGPDGELQVSDLPEPRGVFENLVPAMKAALIDETPSDELGLVPPPVADELGRQLMGGQLSTIPDSTDRPVGEARPGGASPGCRPARSDRAVRDTRVVRSRGRLQLRFRSRRTLRLHVTAVLAGGARKRLAARRLVACRREIVALPRGTRRVELRRRGGRVEVPARR